MIRFRCPACNKTLQTPPHTAGKRVACPCGEKMNVPIPMATTVDEDKHELAPAGFDATGSGVSAGYGSAVGSSGVGGSGGDDIWDSLPPTNSFSPSVPSYASAPRNFSATASPGGSHHLAEAERYQNQREAKQSGGGFFASESSILNSGTIGGGLAMLAAIVWFFGGLAMGIIFFYPPILFIIGLIGFVKGIVNR